MKNKKKFKKKRYNRLKVNDLVVHKSQDNTYEDLFGIVVSVSKDGNLICVKSVYFNKTYLRYFKRNELTLLKRGSYKFKNKKHYKKYKKQTIETRERRTRNDK